MDSGIMKGILFLSLILFCLQAKSQTVDNTYTNEIKTIETHRAEILNAYENADSIAKILIVEATRNYLISKLAIKIFPPWFGTPWGFYGDTRTPQKGTIACGYFVTNILSDIGFKIPRIKWAQSASEVFILILSEKKVKRFRNKPLKDVEDYIISQGEGVYLVGLDIHVGFIIYQNNKMNFIHSNYYQPGAVVVSQDINTNSPLADSKYRIIGKLFSDKMIENWITEYHY